jgi:hypothetical protein
MALIEIVDVDKAELDAEQLRGRNIEDPKPGSQVDGRAIYVAGWVLGRNSPALTVEVVHDGTIIQSAPINVRRPDIVAAFPGVSGAEQSGFRTHVAVPNSGEFELLVQAVLRDEARVPLGVVRARRRRSEESRYSQDENNARNKSSFLARFFRRVSGRRGG